MAKFSFEYVKRNPLMFGIIVVVFGLLFWLLISRGQSSSGGGTSVVTTGPSDAQVAASTQLGLAQLQQSTALASIQGELNARTLEADLAAHLGELQMAYQMADLQAGKEIATMQIAGQLSSMDMQLDAQLQAMIANNQFAVDYASLAYDAAIEQTKIGAQLQMTLGAQQMEAYKFGAMAGAIGDVKANDRDNAFALLAALDAGVPVSYRDKSSGSFSTMGLPNPGTGGGGGGLFGALGGLFT